MSDKNTFLNQNAEFVKILNFLNICKNIKLKK